MSAIALNKEETLEAAAQQMSREQGLAAYYVGSQLGKGSGWLRRIAVTAATLAASLVAFNSIATHGPGNTNRNQDVAQFVRHHLVNEKTSPEAPFNMSPLDYALGKYDYFQTFAQHDIDATSPVYLTDINDANWVAVNWVRMTADSIEHEGKRVLGDIDEIIDTAEQQAKSIANSLESVYNEAAGGFVSEKSLLHSANMLLQGLEFRSKIDQLKELRETINSEVQAVSTYNTALNDLTLAMADYDQHPDDMAKLAQQGFEKLDGIDHQSELMSKLFDLMGTNEAQEISDMLNNGGYQPIVPSQSMR